MGRSMRAAQVSTRHQPVDGDTTDVRPVRRRRRESRAEQRAVVAEAACFRHESGLLSQTADRLHPCVRQTQIVSSSVGSTFAAACLLKRQKAKLKAPSSVAGIASMNRMLYM